MELHVNSVLQYIPENEQEEPLVIRIIWIDSNYVNVYCVYLNGYGSMPYKTTVIKLEQDIENERLIILSDPFSMPIEESSIPESYKVMRDKNWRVVEILWNIEGKPAILLKNKRSDLINETAQKTGLSVSSIKRIMKRFWQRGMKKNALIPDYQKCGVNRDENRRVSEKLGRPRNIDNDGVQTVGINIDSNIKIIMCKYFNNKQYPTPKNAYIAMLNKYFSYKHDIDGKIKYRIWDNNFIPTYHQFYYYWTKNKTSDFKKSYISHRSEKEYNLKVRELLGNETAGVYGPGARYEIDATIADVYLVSSLNRNRIIGRPIVYMVIDVFSRLVAGIYVGLEGPSWIGAMMALDNVNTNKVEFCRKYNIDIVEGEWPCEVLPERILADRGEFEGFNADNLVNNLNIIVENTPPYRADLKGIVERRFKTINGKIKHMSPGAIQKEYRERGDRDYRLDAILDINEFTAIIIHEVMHHNNHMISNYPKDKAMLADEIKTTPIELWRWGIKNRRCSLVQRDREYVRLNLLPRGTARITRQGIAFNKLFYHCKEAIINQWYTQMKTTRVSIAYDPRSIEYIYIIEENGKDFIKCELLEKSTAYRSLYLEEVIYHHELEVQHRNTNDNKENQNNINLHSNVRDIIDNAKKKKISGNNESSSNELKNIRNNRREERENIREGEIFELGYKQNNESIMKKEEDDNASNFVKEVNRKRLEMIRGRRKS